MEDRLSLVGETARTIRHQALALRSTHSLAKIGLARQAELAFATFGGVQRNHMIANGQRSNTITDGFDNATAFMAENGREDAFWIVAGKREGIGMADAGSDDSDEHFTRLRRLDIHFNDLQGLVGGKGYGGTGFYCHGSALRMDVMGTL